MCTGRTHSLSSTARATRAVALGHNGNLVNSAELRAELLDAGVRLASTSDTEAIAALIAHDPQPLPGAVVAAMARLEGAYSVVALVEDTLVAFRDPHGIRPLSLGRIGDDWVVASETCALDLVGADVVRDVRPGEVVWIDADGLHHAQALPEGRGALCIFEHVYFARPDSRVGGSEVHAARVRMGQQLADEAPVDADLVMPIPDSGTPAAIGFAKATGIPFEEGLIKNRYVGRTFIQPDHALREQGIKLKFNPLDEIAGKRLVIVDDSIVRGNTMRALVEMLFDAGAAEVHVRVSSPPVVSPCFYGIDMADEDELAAAHRSVEEMCEHVGATSLHYLSVDGMQAATRLPDDAVCRACFTRDYPTRVPDGAQPREDALRACRRLRQPRGRRVERRRSAQRRPPSPSPGWCSAVRADWTGAGGGRPLEPGHACRSDDRSPRLRAGPVSPRGLAGRIAA